MNTTDTLITTDVTDTGRSLSELRGQHDRMQSISVKSANIGASVAGFGLLEVVLSAGILATVVGASVGLMNASLHRSVLASERATAMNLAQEGIELVRAARDTTYGDGVANDWTAFLPEESSEKTSYALLFRADVSGTCCHWELVQSGPVVSGGNETISLGGLDYMRAIYVTVPSVDYGNVAGLDPSITAEDVIRRVRVVVNWGSGPGQSVESIVYLTDWRSGV